MSTVALLGLVVVTIVAVRTVTRTVPRRPRLMAVLLVVVAVPSLVQFAFPAVLRGLQRDPHRIVHGQWWRLLTSMVVQDGGPAGTVFNLVLLALVAWAAGKVWTVRGGLGWFFGLGFALNLLATAFGVAGAGNSGATLALGGVTIAAVGAHEARGRVLAVTCFAAALVTVVLGDAHGVAVMLGVLAGAVVWAVRRPRATGT